MGFKNIDFHPENVGELCYCQKLSKQKTPTKRGFLIFVYYGRRNYLRVKHAWMCVVIKIVNRYIKKETNMAHIQNTNGLSYYQTLE